MQFKNAITQDRIFSFFSQVADWEIIQQEEMFCFLKHGSFRTHEKEHILPLTNGKKKKKKLEVLV